MEIIRCAECKKPIIEMTKYQSWLELVNFFEFMYNEENITATTRDRMVDLLLTFKPYAYAKEEEKEE